MQHMVYLEGMTTTVNIAVPSEIAEEVRRFAAFIVADRTSSPFPRATEFDSIADYPLWPDDDVVALASSGTVTSRIYQRIMNAVIASDKVSQWVSIPELAEMTGQPESVISTFRTHLYRYINAHMPEGSHAPFTRATGQDLRPTRGRGVHYRISAECAEQWERVRSRIEGAA